jgi:hypothetical protein
MAADVIFDWAFGTTEASGPGTPDSEDNGEADMKAETR